MNDNLFEKLTRSPNLFNKISKVNFNNVQLILNSLKKQRINDSQENITINKFDNKELLKSFMLNSKLLLNSLILNDKKFEQLKKLPRGSMTENRHKSNGSQIINNYFPKLGVNAKTKDIMNMIINSLNPGILNSFIRKPLVKLNKLSNLYNKISKAQKPVGNLFSNNLPNQQLNDNSQYIIKRNGDQLMKTLLNRFVFRKKLFESSTKPPYSTDNYLKTKSGGVKVRYNKFAKMRVRQNIQDIINEIDKYRNAGIVNRFMLNNNLFEGVTKPLYLFDNSIQFKFDNGKIKYILPKKKLEKYIQNTLKKNNENHKR